MRRYSYLPINQILKLDYAEAYICQIELFTTLHVTH
jgi:hypothetical protein